MLPLVVIVVICLAWLWGYSAYKRAVKAREDAATTWLAVEIQLKRRRDAVVGLVAVGGRYAPAEQAMLTALDEDRVVTASAEQLGPGPAARAENRLTGSLRAFFTVVPKYPQMAADAEFQRLQGELVAAERDVTHPRASYNSAAKRFNDRIKGFPVRLFAQSAGLTALPYAESAARDHGVARIDFA